MDNGALVFIIAFEAVIIVWLLSKLKHYQKFEHLLSSGTNGASAPGASSATSQASTPAPATQNVPAASSITPENSATGGLDDELLDMPGVEPEVNIEEAKRVQLVMARCQYAEFYLEQLDDDYERGQFKHIIESCMNTARGIEDPFFRSSALHPVILLLDRAGWDEHRKKLMDEVPDDIIRQRIEGELAAQQASELA